MTSFVHGHHLSPQEIRALSVQQQMDIGVAIAKFTFMMHTLLPVDEAKKDRKQLHLDEFSEEPWGVYLKKTLYDRYFPDPHQDVTAKRYYEEWSRLKTAPEVVLHDDLHTENMFFDNGRLAGVLDFGDTNIGSAEQEFRQLFRINDTVLMAAVHEYNALAGVTLNVQAIKVWAIVQELATYADHLFSGEIQHPAFARAAANLTAWLAMDSWGSGVDMSGGNRKR